ASKPELDPEKLLRGTARMLGHHWPGSEGNLASDFENKVDAVNPSQEPDQAPQESNKPEGKPRGRSKPAETAAPEKAAEPKPAVAPPVEPAPQPELKPTSNGDAVPAADASNTEAKKADAPAQQQPSGRM